MRPGIQAKDIVVGTGEEAVRGKTVIVTVRTFLLDGTELTGPGINEVRIVIDLRRRDCIAGLRYGIEGMRTGGRRELVISPNLAYGSQGVPGQIPPNAKLRCEVELLEVREQGEVKPDDYPPGRQLIVGNTGDLQRGVPKWQFGLHDDGRCGAMVTVPIHGMKWRHVRPKHVEMPLGPDRAAALIENAQKLPERFMDECLSTDSVYVDHSGHDGGTHRTRQDDSLCLAVTLWERGQQLVSYYIVPESPAWMSTGIPKLIRELIAPVLAEKSGGGMD